MSMTQAEFIHYVEIGDFDRVFSEINDPENEISKAKLAGLIKEGIYNTTTLEKWTDFITFLTNKNKKTLTSPDFLISLLDKVIEDERSKQESQHYRCKSLLSYIFTQLASRPNINLMKNHLPELYNILIWKKTHEIILTLMNSHTPPDIRNMHQYLLPLYLSNPNLLYQASKIDNTIFDKLKQNTTNPEVLWYLEKLQSLFKSRSEKEMNMLFAYLIEIEKIEPPASIKSLAPTHELLKLKKTAIQSDAIINKLRGLLEDDISTKEKLESLASSNDDLKILSFTSQISKFLDGYGKLGMTEALLTFARISSNKPYPFDPIALDGVDEFKQFLITLKESTTPQRVKFVITDAHWITGDIKLGPDGHAKIAIYDSLGAPDAKLQSSTIEAMEAFNQLFPGDPIYFNTIKRQHSNKGCSIFAIDDLTHLFTIEHYLKIDLFYYYEQQSTSSNDRSILDVYYNINIHLCDLPLSLMRTTQSLSTIEHIKKQTNDSLLMLPLNKRGENFIENISLFYKPANPSSKKIINARLEHAFMKMAAQNAKYLLSHPSSAALRHKSRFSLEAFEKKIDRENKTGSSPMR